MEMELNDSSGLRRAIWDAYADRDNAWEDYRNLFELYWPTGYPLKEKT